MLHFDRFDLLSRRYYGCCWCHQVCTSVTFFFALLICPDREKTKEILNATRLKFIFVFADHVLHSLLLNEYRVPIHKNTHYRQNTRARAYKTLKKYGQHRRLSPRDFGRQPVTDVENDVEVTSCTLFELQFCFSSTLALFLLSFSSFFCRSSSVLHTSKTKNLTDNSSL